VKLHSKLFPQFCRFKFLQLGPCGCEYDRSLLYVNRASNLGLMKIDEPEELLKATVGLIFLPQPTTM
jgi:hypothetical protein